MNAVVRPINLRQKMPQVCETCAHIRYPGDGSVGCTLDGGPQWDAGDREEGMWVCDCWKRRRPNARNEARDARAGKDA